jgi:hypothetical protein
MQGVRFYEELTDKGRRYEASQGNVLAVAIDERGGFYGFFGSGAVYCVECVGALFDWPNSQVCGTSVARDYLRLDARRVSEARAREVHPALFEYLDRAGA